MMGVKNKTTSDGGHSLKSNNKQKLTRLPLVKVSVPAFSSKKSKLDVKGSRYSRSQLKCTANWGKMRGHHVLLFSTLHNKQVKYLCSFLREP